MRASLREIPGPNWAGVDQAAELADAFITAQNPGADSIHPSLSHRLVPVGASWYQ